MLFPIFLSCDAFNTVFNRISAGPYTVSLVCLMDLILLGHSSQSECCNRCVEECVKMLSESILLSIINFPWLATPHREHVTVSMSYDVCLTAA